MLRQAFSRLAAPSAVKCICAFIPGTVKFPSSYCSSNGPRASSSSSSTIHGPREDPRNPLGTIPPYLLLTAMGPDAYGKIGLVGHHISANNGSLQESKIARLAGQITMIMRVKVPTEEDADQIVSNIMSEEGLAVQSTWMHAPITPFRMVPSNIDQFQPMVSMSMTAVDRPGLVNDVSKFLCSRGFTINGLSSEVDRSGVVKKSINSSGEDVFKLDLEVTLPNNWADMSQSEMIQGLNDIGCRVAFFEI